MKTLRIALVAALALTAYGCKKEKPASSGEAATRGNEHAGKGKEHGGKEHGGKEHAGKEHAGTPAAKKPVTAQDIKDAMNAHITAETAKGGGAFKIKDEKTSENLELVFVKIHDPVRKIEKKVNLPEGYFACTDFTLKGAPEKVYDLDFWFDENLKLVDQRIHKHPEQVAGKWEKKARYTFIDDKPVEIK